jgi:hypothetical protein
LAFCLGKTYESFFRKLNKNRTAIWPDGGRDALVGKEWIVEFGTSGMTRAESQRRRDSCNVVGRMLSCANVGHVSVKTSKEQLLWD